MANITKLLLQDELLDISSSYLQNQINDINTNISDIVSNISNIQDDMANFIKLYEFTELPETGTVDMYDYWNVRGSYACSSSDRARSFLHCPMTQAFIVIFTGISYNIYPLQIYISFDGASIATQFCDNWPMTDPPLESKWKTFIMNLEQYTYS